VASASIGKWLSGVAATVVSGFLLWYLTARQTPAPKPTPAPAATINVEGRVYDIASNKLISGAEVVLVIDQATRNQVSDSGGSYWFVVEGANPSSQASLSIQAAGFQSYSKTATLEQFSQPEDRPLLALAAGGGGSGTEAPAHPSGSPHPPPAMTARVSLQALRSTQYTRRAEAARIELPKH
jgi:hypothetical protein